MKFWLVEWPPVDRDDAGWEIVRAAGRAEAINEAIEWLSMHIRDALDLADFKSHELTPADLDKFRYYDVAIDDNGTCEKLGILFAQEQEAQRERDAEALRVAEFEARQIRMPWDRTSS